MKYLRGKVVKATIPIVSKLGTLLIKSKDILSCQMEYFAKLLGDDNNSRRTPGHLTSDCHPLLEMKEVTHAIKGLSSHKAPGIDGINTEELKPSGICSVL